jgi:hypothetical protein
MSTRLRWSAPLHLLHHDFIISQHQAADGWELIASHPGHEASQRRVKSSNTIREAESAIQKARDRLFTLALVNFHRA